MDRLLVLDGRDSQNREIFLFEDYNKSTTEEEVSETDEEKDDEYSIGLDYLEDESILEVNFFRTLEFSKVFCISNDDLMTFFSAHFE